MEQVLFWGLSAAAVGSAIAMVASLRNAVASALFLVVTMMALAGLFILLHAEFIGLIQVMVYAGAIVVLFLFVIMLLNLRGDGMGAENQPALKAIGTLVAAAVTGKLVLILLLVRAPWAELPEGFGTVRHMGRSLFTDFALPFELTGVLLLAAIVGAVVLAKREL